MRVKVKIEELALEGLPAAGRLRIGDDVKSELARLLTERGLPPGLGRREKIEKLVGREFELKLGGRAEAVGKGVANAIYGGLKQ
jgi:hypothetical protein